MKIMLLCAGGMSTGILMNKMKKYATGKEIELEVKAFGVGDYKEHVTEYDVILMGPQISYKEKEVKAAVSMPVGLISPMDYALGNAEVIIKQAEKIIGGA